MTNQIIINKEEMLKLLAESFEEGYYSYLELKDDFVNHVLQKFLESKDSTKSNIYNLYSTDISLSSLNVSYETAGLTLSSDNQQTFSFNY